jgi:hypothetical protein
MTKVIVYTQGDGRLAIVVPSEGARLASKVTVEGKEFLPTKGAAQPVDRFFRAWPISGAKVEWAETEDQFAERISKKDAPAGSSNVTILSASDLPADRALRGAWRYSAGACYVDMPAAREIHRDRMRVARGPLLAALDVSYICAMESADSTKAREVVAAKQALREVTADPRIDAASTPEELKAVWPDALAG